MSNCYELNDDKSLKLNVIGRFEWIIDPSMLTIFFKIYLITNKSFFFEGFDWEMDVVKTC